VFQDGGILALGANVLNMAVAGVLAGYLPYRLWRGPIGIFAGGVLSVLTSACLALAQLLFSGVPMPRQLMWGSLGLFLVGALIEGAITLAAVRAIERLNPAAVRAPGNSGSRPLAIIGIAAVLLVVCGILFASADPDGIQRLAAHVGVAAPGGNYEMPWFASAWLRKAAAGVGGLALIFGACLITGKFIARLRSA